MAVLPLSAPCVVKTSKFTHITLSVKSLNWLKINDADVIRTHGAIAAVNTAAFTVKK